MAPIIVFVPGAWHKVSQYSDVITRLEKAGYEVHGADYPSTGSNPTNSTFEPDIKAIAGVIEKLADRGDDVLVAVHSAAGILAGEAVQGLSKTDRERNGKKGGVVKLVYIAAFAAVEGTSLWDVVHGPLEWEIIQGQTSKCSRPKELFYNRCTPEQAEENAAQLLLISTAAFTSRTTYAGWKHIPSTYLICNNDNAIPPAAQEGMAAQPGANFEIFRCDADHSPFLCMPEYTTNVIRHAAGESVDL